jgi:hypothetical protein
MFALSGYHSAIVAACTVYPVSLNIADCRSKGITTLYRFRTRAVAVSWCLAR